MLYAILSVSCSKSPQTCYEYEGFICWVKEMSHRARFGKREKERQQTESGDS